MNTVLILLLKFFSACAAFVIGLDLIFDANFVGIIAFSMLLTIVSYLLGDRILLPHIGNSNALLLDFFLAYMAAWFAGSALLYGFIQIAWGSMISALIVTAAEAFIHRYFLTDFHGIRTGRRVQTKQNATMGYRAEMAKEHEPINEKGD